MSGIIIIIAIFLGIIIYKLRSPKKQAYQLPATTRNLLSENVTFYNNLDEDGKALFESRIKDFLEHVRITGIGVTVEDLDRILVASGAIIPIFSFPGWRYNNISEVLLYKGTFNKDYATEGNDRSILGMVGDGAMNRQMILSQQSLRSSFKSPKDGHNTVIHEFTHLIDKADGAVDGVPEYLLSRPYILPWIKEIRQTIAEMKSGDADDINFYGATNDAEFFAVVSEYFFERPQQLKQHHPELYEMLLRMFQPASS